MFDIIVVDAGLAGSVIAEKTANVLNKKVLVVEKRNHGIEFAIANSLSIVK